MPTEGCQKSESPAKKAKRSFESKEDRERFVHAYKMKFKTEMCKNWVNTGSCQYLDRCSFAHGAHELQGKTHVPVNFKTKVCETFHREGSCQFGARCQFLHSERDVNQTGYSFQEMLHENVKVSLARAEMVKGTEDKLVYMNVFKTRRLKAFSSAV